MLIIVGIVALLCCGGAGVGGYFLFKGVANAVVPARNSVDTFLDHLQAGETDAAYGELCGQARAQFSQQQFAALVDNRPRIAKHSITSTMVNTMNGRESATVGASLTYTDGSTDSHTFDLVKESGAWLVCGQPY